MIRPNAPACVLRHPRGAVLQAQPVRKNRVKENARQFGCRAFQILWTYFLAALTGSLTFSKVANSTL